ncbi:MAG: TIGR03960 family B12-binding radical SAM protein, partial [Bacillota bacterium]
FSLESKRAAGQFDIIGFTLQYELSYTNILNMLDLAEVALKSQDRVQDDPLVIAGGPCTVNPEPVAEIFDAVVIGEAEDVVGEIVELYRNWQESNQSRDELLLKLARVDGIYVPSYYEIEYEGSAVQSLTAQDSTLPTQIEKRIVEDLEDSFYPTNWVVPYMDIVHDRINLEVARGCARGCRFCQAGMIYRPVRERSVNRLKELTSELIDQTGYEELSLTSLSTSDYSAIKELTEDLVDEYSKLQVGLSLPSLRADSFSLDLAKKVEEVKKTGLTFAPEAGTQRLRDVINKGITKKDIVSTVQDAYDAGWKRVKLYFMIGLPTETEEDLAGIVKLAKEVAAIGKLEVKVSVSTFIPKPHTPFQWVRFNTLAEIRKKLDYLKQNLRGRGLSLDWNEPTLSKLEAIFARGDRRLGEVLINAWQLGSRFTGWHEHFDMDIWRQAFAESELDLDQYLYRKFSLKDRLPWDHIEVGVTKDYLRSEYKQALEAEVTSDCRFDQCTGCGANQLLTSFDCAVGDQNED